MAGSESDHDDDRSARYGGPERREDHGPFAGLPQWARILAIVGLPGGMACFMLWIGSQSLPKLQTELEAVRVVEAERNVIYQRQLNQDEQIYRLLQRICAEIAKTDEGRARCFDR